MTKTSTAAWAGPDEALGRYIRKEAEKSLNSYREQPNLLAEHANHESDTAHGGYAHRQLFELIQNSADALAPGIKNETADNGSRKQDYGHITIHLTKNHLYCADNGEPIDQEGVRALMFAYLSPKRATSQIGTFGLGFKSVLGVSNEPEFFSRSGSFKFDGKRARSRIQKIAPNALPGNAPCPVLRLPEPIDPATDRNEDTILCELMAWATNIVRLPLKSGGHDDLCQQMREFPTEFLLFVEHVRTLTLTDNSSNWSRTMNLKKVGDEYHLTDGSKTSRWKRFERMHRLSANAHADRRPGDERTEMPICWAAPLDLLKNPGYFWAFFPTHTASLVAGILNAPWKTNADRQNLLPGRYNKELIEAAAEMIADSLPEIARNEDPACHLDALPRRHESGDNDQTDLLRKRLFFHLAEREILPNQNGRLRVRSALSYPPQALTPDSGIDTELFEQWAAYPGRPSEWLHHKALTRTRLAAIDRLFQPQDRWSSKAPRATIGEWLEALCKNKKEADLIKASSVAIQIAAGIPSEIKARHYLGCIVLTRAGDLQKPDPDCLSWLYEEHGSEHPADSERLVHPDLISDSATLEALKKLGIKQRSPESDFRFYAKQVLQNQEQQQEYLFEKFWQASREVPMEDALHIIEAHANGPMRIFARTLANEWKPLHFVLLPGKIVPSDGSRDGVVTIDMEFHRSDSELLKKLGAVDSPENTRDLSQEPWLKEYTDDCNQKWRTRHPEEASQTRWETLVFQSHEGLGPLHILEILSHEGHEGQVAYTDALLNQESAYRRWTMWHKHKKHRYPQEAFAAPAIWMLRKYGRVKTPGGLVPLADALGPHPKNPAALHALLRHPRAEKIKAAFDLSDPIPECFGESDPVPLIDIWPGLREYLHAHQKTSCLIRCEKILVAGQQTECVAHGGDIYLADSADYSEEEALATIQRALELGLTSHERNAILQRKTPQEIEERHAAIRKYSSNAERLLEAVGEQALRDSLPESLLKVLEKDESTLTGVEIAEAAIATYHTDALRRYRQALDHLDPPKKWAGSQRAVRFVRSLGFAPEWAGERNKKRNPFEEIDGPYSLPGLHDYQRTIAGNIRALLRGEYENSDKRRGMISMPTGSGKTRVAVQAIVESIREDGFEGNILWIADRDELCEQAVEAWRQVWSSKGAVSSRLRISRMWGGQPSPQPTSDVHVIVATLQTLNSRFARHGNEDEFWVDSKLVVFDEAHRSIAPTATSVMKEIGLTRRQKDDEPFLLGLTATPYRGHNEQETAWLANRYGRTRLDAGAFPDEDPQKVVQHLQDTEVLALADHATIEGGRFELKPEDWQELEKFVREWSKERNPKIQIPIAWLPVSLENRIASNTERTKRIIQAYDAHIEPDWPTLIFATSVEHAQTVAALLNRNGIPSRAVSGETETATRRRVVEEFRVGKIKALVNYGVFREGFDAPKTRAIIVARPVYSPNLYFQMIGRGLRGPQNGGSDRCLVLNVRDNIKNFDRALAFSELEWLWA